MNRRWKAPEADRQVLIDPPWPAVGDVLGRNDQRREGRRYDFSGRSLADLAAQARQELLEAAHRYTSTYRDLPAPAPTGRILLAGHQPALFHPGVWLKNFCLDALAREHDAAAVNLLIDSDTVKSAALRVPGGTVERPTAEAIPFDTPQAEVAYEERQVADEGLFASFGQRASEEISPLVPDPLLRSYWPLVLAARRTTTNLGQCLAQGRHRLEGEWGLATLELPQSRVCELGAFQWFAAHLLAELPRLHEVHNRALADYRRAFHVRSASHPVPDLATDGDWLEAPFWVWRTSDPRRRRLFVRREGRELALSDRQDFLEKLPAGCSAGAAADALAGLAVRGVRIRTRALMTTLWARLALGDLFVHGIGGAKYDRLTDLLMERFFGLALPEYLVATGTLRLPIERPRVSVEELRQLERTQRELSFQPERHIEPGVATGAETVEQAIAQKRRWIATSPTPANGRERCHALRATNAVLAPWVEIQRQALAARRGVLVDRLAAEALLGSREHAFCLHPAESLRNFLLEFQRARA